MHESEDGPFFGVAHNLQFLPRTVPVSFKRSAECRARFFPLARLDSLFVDDANSKSLDSYNLFRKTENKNMGEREGEISMGRAHRGYCVHIDANIVQATSQTKPALLCKVLMLPTTARATATYLSLNYNKSPLLMLSNPTCSSLSVPVVRIYYPACSPQCCGVAASPKLPKVDR